MQTDHTGRDIEDLKKALEDALSRNESEWFDFKEEGYDLPADSRKAEQNDAERKEPGQNKSVQNSANQRDANRKEKKRAEFVKDILAFSNMVESPGRHCYIFVGVKCDPMRGTNHQLIGVRQHPDDANLQNLVKDWTQQPPPFNYVPFDYKGFSIGAYRLKGGVNSPYVASKTVGDTLWSQLQNVRHRPLRAVIC